MGLIDDFFGGVSSFIGGVAETGAQFLGGVGEAIFGAGLPARGQGLGVLAPRDLGRAGEIGRIVGAQGKQLGTRVLAARVGLPETTSDLGDIYAKFPQLPPIGRGRGVLDPRRSVLPTGSGGIIAESPARAAARVGVENLQTAGVGTGLLSLLPGIGLGLGVEKGLEFLGSKLFGGGEMAATNLPGGLALSDLPLGGALFRPTAGRFRPARVIVVPNPMTGEPTFFGHLGRPLLFSRDLSAHKKVNRLARKAAGRRGR